MTAHLLFLSEVIVVCNNGGQIAHSLNDILVLDILPGGEVPRNAEIVSPPPGLYVPPNTC